MNLSKHRAHSPKTQVLEFIRLIQESCSYYESKVTESRSKTDSNISHASIMTCRARGRQRSKHSRGESLAEPTYHRHWQNMCEPRWLS